MNTLDTALIWRDLGIATIPILARSKSPAIDKWKPYMKRLPTEFELRAWFSRPGYNIAVVTGWQGLVIIDWDDVDKSMAWSVNELFDTVHRGIVQKTYFVETSRGVHIYLYCEEPTQAAKLNGADLKAAGGYCLAPPSIHPRGMPYLAYNSPADIKRINSVADILPEYQQAIKRPPARPRASTLDPLDAAMLPYTNTSIEEANDKLTWEQLTPAHEPHYHYFLCPLHDETRASFKVYPDGSWYCFGCHASGRDKLDLYAQLNGMTIAEALCTL